MKILFPIVLVVLLAFGVYFYQKQNQETMEETSDSTSYSLAEVTKHDNKDDCWLVIEGKIYDVTPFIKSGNHPGGAAILEGCGKDATVLFNTRPMGSGQPHSSQARTNLPNLQIGVLAE